MPLTLNIQVNRKLYLKDPSTSDLGNKIIAESINMIEEIGFESFTMRKLAVEINSTEASIYRYFESKQKLLSYLISWYWSWMEYRLVFATANIDSAKIKLERAIELLTEKNANDINYNSINIKKLSNIVFTESTKTFLTKDVDRENKIGAFGEYKNLVEKIAALVTEYCPRYKYPNMLISTVIEGSHLQHFFTEHLPRLTNNNSKENHITNFYLDIVFKTLTANKK